MAHQLKSVIYQSESRKILLQNENGPCPLLAAANALLLRGIIKLPSTCIRSDQASIDEVLNVLANDALQRAKRLPTGTTNDQQPSNTISKRSTQDSVAKIESDSKQNNNVNKSPDNENEKHDPDFKDDDMNNNTEETIGKIEDDEQHSSSEYHINGLLSLFPNLQFGMDVNPKFTEGPTGVEYTKNISAFDLMGVEMVHGWLLDPQDEVLTKLIGAKTYNELITTVIQGGDIAKELEQIAIKLQHLQSSLPPNTDKELTVDQKKDSNEISNGELIEDHDDKGINTNAQNDEEWVKVDNGNAAPGKIDSITLVDGKDIRNDEEKIKEAIDEKNFIPIDAAIQPEVEDTESAAAGDNDQKATESSNNSIIKDSESTNNDIKIMSDSYVNDRNDLEEKDLEKFSSPKDSVETLKQERKLEDERENSTTEVGYSITSADEKESYPSCKEREEEIQLLTDKMDKLTVSLSNTQIIKDFLDTTSHQLTYYGLSELQNHLTEQSISVFFRNNHFSTITKQNGILYLLVTDLGYSNVPEVMWEKLDEIDGNTEYMDSNFQKSQIPLQQHNQSLLTSEQILAQTTDRSEADYQLALNLSKNGGNTLNHSALDEEEGKLIAAATEASLQDWGENPQQLLDMQHNNDDNESHVIDSMDRAVALKLQEEFYNEQRSEALARQLQNEERQRSEYLRLRNNHNNSRRPPATSSTGGRNEKSSGCTIS